MTDKKFAQSERYTINGKHYHPKNEWPGCPSWLQFKLLVDLILNQFTPSEWRRSLKLGLSALDPIICKIANSITPCPLSHWNSAIIFSTIQTYSVREVFISSRTSTVTVVMFTRRVTSLTTCQFLLFVTEYLTNWYKFCMTFRRWSFCDHFGEIHVILLQTVAKWLCIQLCAFFSGTLCSTVFAIQIGFDRFVSQHKAIEFGKK